ncbi:MAG: tandem-95 repeat protein [Pseudomonadota bacterium]
MDINFNQVGDFNGIEGGPQVLNNPTSLAFGPDGRLYVSEQNGTINAFTMTVEDGEYKAVAHEVLTVAGGAEVVKSIQNHNDDGSEAGLTNRQVTGLVVTGTVENPVLYISSSSPEIASNGEKNLDTNSGVVTRATFNGTDWETVDIIRGLPRSEENHSTNGLALSADGETLFVQNGGNTNNGAPSGFFSYTGEYTLSGALLAVDLNDIESRPILTDPAGGQGGLARDYIYDLPTLDDPNIANDGVREDANGLDVAGPWGGNDGLNQAILPADAPLRIYADGFRNPFDIVVTDDGRLYTVDNGSNGGLGGNPVTDANGEATHAVNNGGTGDPEPLFKIEEGGYYGHANPTRANQDLAWTVYDDNGNPDQNVAVNFVPDLSALVPDSVQIQDGFLIDPSKFTGDPDRLLESGVRVERSSPESNTLVNIGSSSNGLVEYKGDAFDGALDGALVVAQFNGNLTLLNLNDDGTEVEALVGPGNDGILGTADDEVVDGDGVFSLASGLSVPLDVTMGPDGTLFVAEIGGNGIKVFAPSDLVLPDDPDFDNDGILNTVDAFIRDASNGSGVLIQPGQQYVWDFDPDQDGNLPGPSGYGGGLTGVMVDGITDFEQFFQEPSTLPDQVINLDNVKFLTAAGGGTIVVENVSNGDPFLAQNSGTYLFHTGVKVAPTVETFTVKWTMFNPVDEITGTFQQIGGYIGTGDQSNYLKVVAIKNSDAGSGIQLSLENGDAIPGANTYTLAANDIFDPAQIPESGKIFIELLVDPVAETAIPTVTYETINGDQVVIGTPVSLTGSSVLDAINGDFTIQGQESGLAVGLFSSNTGELEADTFQAIFDEIEINATGDTSAVTLYRVNTGGPEIAATDGGPNWLADTATANSEFVSNPGSNNTTGFPGVEPGATVPGTVPGAIFDTERWDMAGGDEMSFSFEALQAGLYEVRLYVGNGFSGTSAPGQRVFDVEIEGQVLSNLDDVDLSARFGHETGGLISNVVEVTDGAIDIEFIHGTENPLINGIEIIQLGGGDDGLSVSIVNGPITVGESDGQTQVSILTSETVPNDETVSVSFTVSGITASAGLDFDVPGASFDAGTQTYSGTVVIAGGSSDVTIPITILPDGDIEGDEALSIDITGVSANASIGTGSATITIADDDVADGTVLYRVNAGGAEVAATDGGPAWSADTQAENSPFLSNPGSNNDFPTNGQPTGPIDTSLLNGFAVPEAVLGVERFDLLSDTNGEMAYSFDVAAGSEVEIRLYLAELFTTIPDADLSGDPTGDRVFSVSVDGIVPAEFTNIDQYALAGDFLTGAVVTSRVVSDGTVDLEFLHGVENPSIKGIEIVQVGGGDPVDSVNGTPVIGGDFSSDAAAPSSVTLAAGGATTVFSALEGGQLDRDFITVDIPEGFRLVDVTLANYDADQGNSAFIGLVAGDNFVIDPAVPALGITPDGVVEPGDLLGGLVYNDGDVGTDLLTGMNNPTFGFQGFDEGNLTGQLTFWLNQGGNPSSAELVFVTEAIPDNSNIVAAINAGGPALTQDGIDFEADTGFLNGSTFADGNAGNGQQPVFDGTVFETERFGGADGGTLSYEIPVSPGLYEVELYFAEIFASGAGTRVFDVTVEGQIVLDDFDILAQTGGDINQPIVFTLPAGVSPDAFGNAGAIDIDFSASADNAKISAIVVRDVTPPAPTGGEAQFSVTVGSDDVQISNFGGGSFVIQNTGTKKITNIEIDVTNALYPDSVFDPFGVAGDTVSKPLTIGGGSSTGVTDPSTYNPYIGAGGTAGFEGLSLIFDTAVDGGFETGETVTFAVDMDPNSIAGSTKGILDSGAVPAWDIGGVSGAELIGSTYTITFEDGTTATGQLSGAGNQGGSLGVASQDIAGLEAVLTVNNLGEGDVGNYSDGGPTVIVDGPAGETVRVVLTKGIIQPVNNNFPEPFASQLDAQLAALAASDFPANNAAEFQTVDVLLTGAPQDISALFNFADVPGFELPFIESQLPLGFVATIIDPANGDLPKGPVSDPIYAIYAENAAPTIDPIADIEIAEFETASFTVAAADADGDPITLSVVVIRDVNGEVIDPAEYNFADNGDGTASFEWITDEPDEGAYTISVTADDGASQAVEDLALIVNEVGAPVGDTPLFRVNVGGPAVAAADGTLGWGADNNANPSPNLVSGGNGFPSTGATIDITDPSIPDAAPAQIFQNERFDLPAGDPLAYSFDVAAGTDVVVNLYFAETFSNLPDLNGNGDPTGDRIFDVSVDGVVPAVFDDIDQYTLAGESFNKGFVLSFQTTSDGSIDLAFLHQGFENTTAKAIEIIALGAADETPPDAVLTAADVTAVGSTYEFQVEYTDATAVDVSTLDSLDVTVSGPGGSFTTAATFVSVDVPADGGARLATYAITPPGGAWDEADNGDYTITLNEGEVTDIFGNAVVEEVLGTFAVNVQPTDQVEGGQLDVAVTPGADVNASTFAQGSFQLFNASAAGVNIASVTFDLSTGFLPDMVFDPTGAGGDATASPFTPNSGAVVTGLVVPGDPAVDPFSDPRNGGFDKLTIDFTDFNPGETFTFTTDIDPNSIQAVPGAGAAGAVSGYELIGSTITVTFTDGTNTEMSLGSLFEEGSLGGSVAQITSEDVVAAPTLAVVGAGGDLVGSLPGDQVDVLGTNFDVQITGTPGASFELLQVDTRLFIASGAAPFDVTAAELPFHANEAMTGQAIFTGTFDASGIATVSASLLETQGAGNTPDGGLNYLVARVTENGEAGLVSAPLVVKQGAGLVLDDPGVMVFDGSPGAVMEIPHDAIYEIPEGTVAFSFTADNVSGPKGLFTKDASFFVGGGNHFVLYLDGNTLTARFQDGANSAIMEFDGIQAGTEYEIAATFGTDGVELWVDGNLIDADPLIMDWTQNVEFIQWGGRGWGSASGQPGFDAPFSGTIADKQIYSEALTASQIAALAARSSASNAAPTAVDDTATVAEDGSVNIDVVANDSDADGDIVTLAGVAAQPANGTAVAEADGTVTYTPNPDFNGTDSFDVSVSDGQGGTAISTVTVTVTGVNDDPIAVDDSATTVLETAAVIDVLANDIDVDGDTLIVAVTTDGANGSVTVNPDGTVTYTPDAGFIGDDSFTYTVDDQAGGAPSQATVDVTVLGAPNIAPVAVADADTVAEDGSVTFQPGTNDTDANGDTVVGFVIAAQPANGLAVVNPDGTVTYTPNANFNGVDTFDVTVTDGNGGFDTATATITVTPVNDAPVANDDAASTAADEAVIINVLGNDTDVDGDALSIAGIVDAANGTVVDNGNGTVTYTPDAGFEGTDTFAYDVTDGDLTDTATVTVEVSAFPDPIFDMPGETSFNGQNNGVIEIAHNPTFSIPEGTVNFSFTAADTNGAQGLFVKDASGFVGGGNHLAIYLDGSDLIARFQDGANSVSLVIPGINAGQQYDLAATFGPGGSTVYLDGAEVASDPLVMDWTQNVEVIQFGGRGWASASGATGFDAPFQGIIADKQIFDQALDADQIVELHTDGPVNGAPVAVDDDITVIEDGSTTFDPVANDSDPEGDPLAPVAVVAAPANGSAIINGDGTVTYTPDADFAGSDAFDISIGDGNGGIDVSTVNVTVTPVDDDPVAVDDAVATQVGQAVVVDVLANDIDVDGDALSVVANGTAANGTVVDNGDGTITYTPDAGFLGSDSFEYTVSDGAGPTDTATVSVDVTDEPVVPEPVFELAGVTTFNGSNGNVVNVAPTADLEIAEGTIAFSFIDDNPGTRQGLVTKDASGFVGGGNHLAAYIEGGDLNVRFQDGVNSEVFVFENLVAGQEYEVAATFGAGGVALFVDGALVDQQAGFIMNWETNQEFLQVGGLGWASATGASDFTNPLSGQMADVEIYDEVLDNDGIQLLANSSSFDFV